MKREPSQPTIKRRVIIASSHALFGEGLHRLLRDRREAGVEVVGIVTDLDEALQALERLSPDLIIVDYDDEELNRDEFLARFVEGEKELRVVLLSLQDAKNALVYDRRSLAASQIDDWLRSWNDVSKIPASSVSQGSEVHKTNNGRTTMKHLIVAGILVIAATVLLILGLGQVNLLPIQASLQAEPIDWLFDLEFKVIAFLFSLIVVFMVYSIIVFRRKSGDQSDAKHVEGNTRLEVLWTLAPLATVLIFAYLGGGALADTVRADPQALEINVIGQQWSWVFEYPQVGVTSDTLYMPVSKQAILHLSSRDVIHSFWVPEFRVKQDALPGGEEFVRDLRVTPSIIGEYKLRCAELCGVQHATMLADVIVVSQADFDAWVLEQTGVSDDPVERGEKWARETGCLGCHSVDGSQLVGPSWLGVFGSQEELEDGTSVLVDEAYLLASIREPGKQIVAGYPNVMPQNYSELLTEEQILDIIAFIMSLSQ